MIPHFIRYPFRGIFSGSSTLNGKRIGSHHGQYTAFETDATDAAKAGKNILVMRILTDNGPRFGTKPAYHTYGSHWWMGMIAGGITGNVELSLEPEIRIVQALIEPDLKKSAVRIRYTIINNTQKAETLTLKAVVTSAMKETPNHETGRSMEEVTLHPGENKGIIECPLKDPVLWRIGKPYLYYATLILTGKNGTAEAESFRFGYRDFRIRNRKFELNGEPIFLFSGNISSHNFEDVCDSREFDRKAEKYLLGFLNRGLFILRTSHMPIRDRVLETADECGVMIAAEWSWAFTAKLDHEKWKRHVGSEVKEFIENSYNHPSVVLWSMGNEVSHINDPAIADRFNEIVRLVRKIDRTGRPVSAYSASASIFSYGKKRLDTDLLDSHSYTGLSAQWTGMRKELDVYYRELLRIYADGKKELPIPWVGWEHIGFSWGFQYDKTFRPGDREAYMKYAANISDCSWANPVKIGFSGSIGVAAAVDPARGSSYGMKKYMPRIFSTILLDARMSGYAPWNPAPDMDFITQISQPVFPILVNDSGLFPGSIFSGEPSVWNFALVNVSSRTASNLELEILLAGRGGKTIPLAKYPVRETKSFTKSVQKISLNIPSGYRGHHQLRLILRNREGKEVARNYYNVFAAEHSVKDQKIKTVRPMFLLDTGNAGNTAAAKKLLERHGINAKIVKDAGVLKDGVLIVPAELSSGKPLDLSLDGNLRKFVETGGFLLILEQKNQHTKFPDGSTIHPAPMNYIDLVSPGHPVFKGLDQRNFDTWLGNPQGTVTDMAFSTFQKNAVAAKGVRGLGARDLGSAILESKLGKGRILASQLNASSLHDTDSSAAVYFVNLLRYAAGGGEYWKDTLDFKINRQDRYEAAKGKCRVIPLEQYVTTSFRDDVADDRKGGWTDQGKNDFRDVKTGMTTAAGIPFRIIDPAQNNGKSCIVLCGTNRPYFPESVKGIRIGGYFSRLFFLHTSAWGNSNPCAVYRIHYEDGTHCDYQMTGRQNVADWWSDGALPKAKIGIPGNKGRSGLTFVAEWANPAPWKKIASMDFLSMRAISAETINYLPTNESVPILLAVTGEECSAKSIPFPEKGSSDVLEIKFTNPGKLVTDKEKRMIRYTFPKISSKMKGGREPGMIFFFRKGKGDPPDAYHTISFEARSSKPVRIRFSIPCSDWKHVKSIYFRLPAGQQFHSYRLLLDRGKNPYWQGCTLRGEFLLQATGKESSEAEVEFRNVVIQ